MNALETGPEISRVTETMKRVVVRCHDCGNFLPGMKDVELIPLVDRCLECGGTEFEYIHEQRA